MTVLSKTNIIYRQYNSAYLPLNFLLYFADKCYHYFVNMRYLTSSEIAKKWNLSERSVRNYCASGRVLDCYLEGKTWFISENALKPMRSKRKILTYRNLLDSLIEEKQLRLKGRIYHKLQIEYTYNSNHIEGSRLTHDQTRLIFETNTIGITKSNIKVDDIVETMNHFKCIDFVIDNAKRKLTESMIKQLHYLLKQNTSDSFLSWFKVGDYKLMENEVGGHDTVKPECVKDAMKKLINSYNSIEKVTIEDIIDFHYQFEIIHPFQDGNGRIGRLIMLKECLRNNIVPIIIKDEFKDYYYRGLKEYKTQKGYLVDTCLHGQDIIKSYLDYFKIRYCS